ncbi:MAG: hypothetical protein HKN23_13855 [Verrucomicrobiales bacterium]|nr:hypothetical protein [Verrucomicrobiales bacterium]
MFRSEIDATKIQEKRKVYKKSLADLESTRLRLAESWNSAQASGKKQILAEARSRITTALVQDIFPAWYGTEWNFNGISQQPGEGSIACGYFVTTTLRDAGFKLNRVKLAQQPSQRIIKSLSNPEDVDILYQKTVSDVMKYIGESGPGIYIVGLDTHTGFVVHDGKNQAFVHSSYYRPPFSVTSEPIEGTNPLADSKYRVFGKILSDEMLRKWIAGEYFPLQ